MRLQKVLSGDEAASVVRGGPVTHSSIDAQVPARAPGVTPRVGVRRLRTVFVSRQFGVFLVVGALSALVNFLSGAAVRIVSTSAPVYGASIVVGMVAGTVLSFFLNRRFTFAVTGAPAAPQAARFALVAVGAIVLAALFGESILFLWQRLPSPWFSRNAVESLAHVGAIGVNTIYGFLAIKYYAMRQRPLR